MRKFRFRFATILKHRKAQEEGALRSLGAAQRAYQEAAANRKNTVAQLNASLERREKLGSIATDVLAFQIEQSYILGTKQRIIQADQAIVRATRAVEKALRHYLACRRQTKMFETLYDKDLREWKLEQAKREQKRLDDLTIMRARMKEEVA